MARLTGYLRDRLSGAGMDAHAAALVESEAAPAAAARDEPTLSVTAHLEAALADSAAVVPSDVQRATGVLARAASWRQTASYVESPPSAEFLDNYAHATLLGPPDDVQTSDVPGRSGLAVGLVLLGPGVVYPPHQHPADEVYVPLQRIEWTHERDAIPAAVEAGDLIHHLPWQPHSMRVGSRPGLLLYLWSGDVVTPSRFCA